MSSTKIHLVSRKSRGLAERPAASGDTGLQLSPTPVTDPVQIFRRLPAVAMSPALFELLDLMTSPVLLISHSPAGELPEIAPEPASRMAA